jgi:hypothetical protein
MVSFTVTTPPNRQELKQEVGLGNYEGRGWRGFHHHATLCIAADGFLIAEQPTITLFLHAVPGACPTRQLSTQRICPRGLNDTFRIRL